MVERTPISVVIPTFNEEANVEHCLESVSSWVDEIVVVDSGSNDRTLAIASRFTRNIENHAYENAPKQWEWILSHANLRHNWILALDADYVVTPDLADAIRRLFDGGEPPVDGYYVRHRQMFRGRFIRHGGIYPRYRLCLFRKTAVFVDRTDLVDNRFYVEGKTAKLEYDVIEDNAKEFNLSVWMKKQIEYADRAAREEMDRRRGGASPMFGSLTRGRNERVLWLKRRWANLPKYWRSVGYFLYRYLIRGGFLDGREGFLYHFTQALAFRVMLDARLEELERAKAGG